MNAQSVPTEYCDQDRVGDSHF